VSRLREGFETTGPLIVTDHGGTAAMQDCRLLDSLLEIAHATTLIADPGDQAHFLKQRRVRTWARKHVADLRDFPLCGCVVDFLAKLLAVLVF
jgi:hypothetical protein